MLTILGISLAVSVVINISMFLIAFKMKSDKLTDVSYAFSFVVLAIFAALNSEKSPYHLLLAGLIILWGLRIGSFLLYRVIKAGKDQRFDGMREDFLKFGKFWLTQAIVVWILMIPSLFAFESQFIFTGLSFGGILLWALGLLTEAVADFQKFRFSQDSKNKDKWIEVGIWKYSRHPNYFGEILVWTGVYMYVVASLIPLQAVVGLISPIFITVLLLFISGIPILEKSADRKWGRLKTYRNYKKQTSILIPLPRRKG